MEHKTFPGIITKVDGEQGIVEQVVAVFGNLDLGGDVIHPGAFVKTIAERGLRVRCLDNHQTDSIMRVLGKTLALREIGREELPADLLTKTPTATGGLWVRTQYLLDTPEGKGAFVRIREGAIDEYSIGYDALDVDYSKLLSEGKQVTARNLRTLKLYEYSPVLWGMNTATATVSAKGAGGEDMFTKAVVPFGDLPLADRAMAWDRAAADVRVREWAGATDAPNDKYRRAFVWYDSEAADNFGSYKLQIGDIVDGSLKAVPRGVFAVAGVIQGARGGVDIPEGDMAGVKAHIARYYTKMDMTPPWEGKSANKEMTPNGPMRRMGDNLIGTICQVCDGMLDSWLTSGMINEAEHATMRQATAQATQMLRMAMPPDMAERDCSPRGMDMMLMSGDGPDEAKAGRVLSASNATRLQNALTEINDVLKAAGLLDAGDSEKESNQDGKSAPSGADNSQQAAKAGPVTPPTSNGMTLALLEAELGEFAILEV